MSVSTSSIRSSTWSVIYNLINDNKETGWTVRSAWPEDKPAFPLIIINSPLIDTTILTMDSDGNRNYGMEITIELYAKWTDQLSKIEEGKDNITSTILDNVSSLEDDGVYFSEDVIDDSNTESFTDSSGARLNSAIIILNFNHKR